MLDDFDSRLIETTRIRLSPELRYQYDQLSQDAQMDIAITLMYCADRLPPVFRPEHLETLATMVEDLVRVTSCPAEAVH